MKQQELKKLLNSLTLDEKIGQLVQLNGNFFDSNEKVATGPITKIGINKEKIQLTGSILNTMGANELKRLQDKYLAKSRTKIPMLFMADILNGFKTIFPIPLGLGCSFEPELVKKTAQIAAKEAAVSGIHVTFSPMVDMARDARWGRVMETYSEDNLLNCLYSKAMVEGYQGDHNPYSTISACVKHFAGYGAPIAGRDYNTVELSERTLREFYLPSYKAAVDAGCDLVMASFNTIDGIPVTANSRLLRNVLRDEWGFEGVVISDHSGVKELICHGIVEDEKEAAKLALEAGCDIDMMTATYSNYLKELVENHQLDERYIDEAVMRVLELKNKLGLFENKYRGANEELEKKYIMCEEFRQFAKEVVTKTCVLLKNDSVLPLNRDNKIALVGPYGMSKDVCGMWSINVDSKQAVTVFDGLKKKYSQVSCAKGAGVIDDDSLFESFNKYSSTENIIVEDQQGLIHEAIEIAKDSDAIIVAIGEHPQQSGEGGSRGELSIAPSQIRLLKEMHKLNKPIVTLIFSGRPLALKDVSDNSDAILQCWFPGTEAGDGIAEIICGEVNPSARLTMTFPYSVGQCPIYYNEFSTGRPAKTSKHSRRFTSRYIDIPNDPYYCFGYGLSYSCFCYGEIQLDQSIMTKTTKIKACIEVTNTSSVEGIETVQLYIRDLVGSVVRPVKELKDFKKITLQAGETKKVEFTIDDNMLKFVRADYSFDSEPGKFELYIGHDSSVENKKIFYLKDE